MRFITLSTTRDISSKFMCEYFSRTIAAISARSSLPLFGAISKAAVAPTTAPPKRANSTFDPVVIDNLGLIVKQSRKELALS
jgi:hypothetical protein